MTDAKYTHLLVIVDRSGSMGSIKNDMVGGLDAFFAEQAKDEGVTLVDYVQFDDTYEVVFTDRPVADAKAVLEPRGMTALLDAVGKGATDLGKKLAKLPEARRPGNVIVVVVTDGYENASREWNAAGVKALIKEQEEKWNWTFTFLGANMDAVAIGASFGFSTDYSMTYDTANVGAMTASLASNVTRTKGGDRRGYTQDERESQKA